MKIPIKCGKIDDYHDDDDEGEEMKMKMKMKKEVEKQALPRRVAGSAPTKKKETCSTTYKTLWSVVSRRAQRDRKKKRCARDLVIAGGARNGPPLARTRTHAKHL